MTLETAPTSNASTGNWLITYTPSGTGLSVAVLTGGTAKTLTYGFTPDGFDWQTAQNEVEDKRLTMAQILTAPGNYKETLKVRYVESTTAGSPCVVLTNGVTGILTVRRGGVANATALTIGQKVDVITFTAGIPRLDAPTENGLDTFSQDLFITAATVRGGTLVA